MITYFPKEGKISQNVIHSNNYRDYQEFAPVMFAIKFLIFLIYF